jgi:hypothetical protein
MTESLIWMRRPRRRPAARDQRRRVGFFAPGARPRWLGFRAAAGQHFLLDTASQSALGYENKLTRPAIRLWNETGHVET